MKLEYINDNNNIGHKYPKFTINSQRNFCFNNVTRSPMYLLFLGMVNTCLLLTYILGKVFDIEKLLCKGVKNNIE